MVLAACGTNCQLPLNVHNDMQNNEKSRSIRFCMHKCMYTSHKVHEGV